jgi:hypothetical protein
MLEALRSGDWLTARRIHAYSLILGGLSAVLFLWLFVTAHGLLDYQNRPLGTDFSTFWAAGQAVLDGQAGTPYAHELHAARQRAIFGPDAEFYPWMYPPLFLVVATALASLPYIPALLLWNFGTLALYVDVIRRILPAAHREFAVAAAVAFPAVFVNFGHGNNAALTAALLGGALLALRPRPVLAGILFGLMTYKPHFGLLIPVALVADRRWTTLAAAAGTIGLVGAGTALALGPAPWLGFVDGLAFSRTVVLEQGGIGFHRLQSAFAAVRLMGGSVGAAYAAQAAVTAPLIVSTWVIWRSGADQRLKSAFLAVAALLATPYLFDYDLVVLAVAGAFFVSFSLEHGFSAWEKTLLIAVAVTPPIDRLVANLAGAPLGFVSLVVVAFLILRRIAAENGWRAHRSAAHGV